jgi:ubiquinone/menaquinone biosynthesis C-methylase UbiE
VSWQSRKRILWARLLRFGFWLLYNPLAWTYDWVSCVVSLGQWRAWQRTALAEVGGGRVLELASGTGNLLLDLHALGTTRPIGLDLSPHMIRIARCKLRRRGIDLPLVRGRAEQLPFATASIDTVLSTFPASFILAPQTLEEIARVLEPGGHAAVVATAKLTSRSAWTRVLEWLYRITGQRGPLPDLSGQLAAAGLTYRSEWRPVDGTSVLLLVLRAEIREKRFDG